MPVVQPAVPIRISQRVQGWEVSGILGSAVPIGPSAVPVPRTGSAGQAIGSSDQRSPEDQVFGGLWDPLAGSANMATGSSGRNFR